MTTRYLDEIETAERLGISRRTLQRWRSDPPEGGAPPWARLGARRIGYPEDGIAAWAAARTYDHRAAEMAGKAA